VDVIVATPDEIARYRESYCLVYYPAVREGRVVYKKEKDPSASDRTNAARVAEEEPSSRKQRFAPDDPRAWLQYARSDLALARAEAPEIYLEHLCFHAQQAVEKALKAVLIMRGVRFPYTHDIADLATSLEQSGQPVPDHVKAAEALSRFAIETCYPRCEGEVTPAEYQQTVAVAEAVMRGAELLVARVS
jgi:HEPN domain-containing protein